MSISGGGIILVPESLLYHHVSLLNSHSLVLNQIALVSRFEVRSYDSRKKNQTIKVQRRLVVQIFYLNK